MKLILALVVFPTVMLSPVFAAPIQLWVVSVDGEHQMTDSEKMQMIDLVTEQFRSIGVDLRFKRYYKQVEIAPELATLDKRLDRLYWWGRWAKRRGMLRRNRIVYFLFPPVNDGEKLWITGYARGHCTIRKNDVGFAYSAAINQSGEGEPWFLHSAQAMIQEISALLGAHADNSEPPTATHNGALYYVDQFGLLPWSNKSLEEIQGCLK